MAFRNKFENPLHKAASYNTIFTLSGLTEQEIRSKTFLSNAPHDIIARSGGIGNPRISRDPFAGTGGAGAEDRIVRDAFKEFNDQYAESIEILERGHDLFVENVNILSTLGPNNERNLANFTKMEFEIHEPYGITLIEKVRAATAINGFRDYQDAPLLLTIEFKGFDEHGKPAFFPGIEGTLGDQKYAYGGIVRKIPILIVRVDFDVNEGGAKYSVVAVPYTDMGFDDRFKFPRTKIPIAANQPFQWAIEAEKLIRKDMETEITNKKRQYADVYKFEIDKEVQEQAKGYATEDESQSYNKPENTPIDTARDLAKTGEDLATLDSNTGPKTFSSFAQANSFTALPKFFEDAIRGAFGYAEMASNFWVGYLNSLDYKVNPDNQDKIISILQSQEFADRIASKPFIPWFKIKSTVLTDTSRLDKITKMHPKTVIFRAMPYQVHVLKMVGAGMSAKADWSSYVRKEYNYIYTGDNVDVQGLRINYKSAYYMRNVREAKTQVEDGVVATIKQNILEAFGKEDAPEITLPLRSYPSVLKGRSSVEAVNKHNPKAQEFYDYLTNPEADMMRIELEILGDPAFLAQDIYVPSAEKEGPKRPDFDQQLHSFNADSFMPCINLTYRLPSDINDKEGTMFGGDGKKYREENLFFSGVYQVVKVDNQISSGQFTQTLTCVRLNNQGGEGVPIALINSAQKGFAELEKKEKIEKDKIDNIERNSGKDQVGDPSDLGS